jgi:hypothetical protein
MRRQAGADVESEAVSKAESIEEAEALVLGASAAAADDNCVVKITGMAPHHRSNSGSCIGRISEQSHASPAKDSEMGVKFP